jgi:hypothetical protein
MGNNEYLTGHDRVRARINYSESKAQIIEKTKKKYPSPEPVCEHDDVTGLWNQGVRSGTHAKYVN